MCLKCNSSLVSNINIDLSTNNCLSHNKNYSTTIYDIVIVISALYYCYICMCIIIFIYIHSYVYTFSNLLKAARLILFVTWHEKIGFMCTQNLTTFLDFEVS